MPPPADADTRRKVDELRNRLSDVKARFDAGKWREALTESPRLVDGARALKYQPLLAETLALHGFMLSRSNNSNRDAAEEALVESFWAADASRHDEVRAQDATSLVFLVGIHEGRFKEALRWAKTAESILSRMGGHQLLQSWLLNDLGCVYGLHGDHESALRVQEEAIGLKERVLGKDHPDVGLSETNIALALTAAGRYEEALRHVNRSVAVVEKGLGVGHPDVGTQLSNRGEILNALHRYREARESFERARAIWERELSPDSLNIAYALTGIGIAYLEEGNPDNALVPLERALKIRQQQEQDIAQRSETRFALARALWDANRDRGRARALAEQARTDYAKSVNKTRPSEIDAWLRNHQLATAAR